jgi:alkane 1-monooxygenase
MSIRVFKYLSPFLIYYGSLAAFFSSGFVVWIPVLYAWFFIPLLELFLRPDETNMNEAEEELARKNRWYDLFLYFVVPFQYIGLACFLFVVTYQQNDWVDLAGKTMVMGLLCGVMGINVGHELGHRSRYFERLLAKALLLSSLYLHFFIEHNKGHHKRVATPEDPSSARYGEGLYAFFFRSIIFSYISAWKIAIRDAAKKRAGWFTWNNEMLIYQIVQVIFLAGIWLFFGWLTTLLFLLAAIQGILLLETVNYIEHYGLRRKATGTGTYERTQPLHSWNSNHVIGRVMLFELSRHSDHHFMASRKYQLLRHHDHSPQMLTGYPGMMLLASIPPIWFRVMNKRVREVQVEV